MKCNPKFDNCSKFSYYHLRAIGPPTNFLLKKKKKRKEKKIMKFSRKSFFIIFLSCIKQSSVRNWDPSSDKSGEILRLNMLDSGTYFYILSLKPYSLL